LSTQIGWLQTARVAESPRRDYSAMKRSFFRENARVILDQRESCWLTKLRAVRLTPLIISILRKEPPVERSILSLDQRSGEGGMLRTFIPIA
jgi:hypothetical protein